MAGPKRSGLAEAVRVADFGLRFVIITLLGAGAGFWLDRKFGLAPALTVVGFFLGLGLALVGLIHGLRQNGRGGESDGDVS